MTTWWWIATWLLFFSCLKRFPLEMMVLLVQCPSTTIAYSKEFSLKVRHLLFRKNPVVMTYMWVNIEWLHGKYRSFWRNPFKTIFFQKEHFLNGTGSDSLFQLPLNFLSKKHFGTRIPKKLSKLLDLGYIPLHICFFYNTPCM